jgi:hypothetical protein
MATDRATSCLLLVPNTEILPATLALQCGNARRIANGASRLPRTSRVNLR